jgi:hypothetical protein
MPDVLPIQKKVEEQVQVIEESKDVEEALKLLP